MQEARLLVSRVEALENFVKQRGLQSDIKPTKPSESPLMALHIISDILLTKGNLSNGKDALPGNIKVNIALKNAAPSTAQHGQKFLVNSTVQLMDSSKVNEVKSDLARSQVLDGVATTERQVQNNMQLYSTIHGTDVPYETMKWFLFFTDCGVTIVTASAFYL